MANQQLLLLRSLEHLTTAPSYRPKRQGRPIPLQPIVAQFSQRPIRRPRIQRTALLAPTSLRSRPLGQKRIVRRQPSRPLGRKPTGPSLLSGRKLLRRASVRSPRALLLLRKRSVRRRNDSARSPGRRSRKRRSKRTNSRRRTRSRRSNGRVSDWDLVLWASWVF